MDDADCIEQQIWLIEFEHGEFQAARDASGELPTGYCLRSMSLAQALAADQAGSPSLIVLGQSGRSNLDQSQIDQLAQQHALSGKILLVSSLAEGEPRTGRPLEFGLRRAWYQLPHLLEDFCNDGATRDACRLPQLATDADQMLARVLHHHNREVARNVQPRSAPPQRLAVVGLLGWRRNSSPELNLFQCLSESCRHAKMSLGSWSEAGLNWTISAAEDSGPGESGNCFDVVLLVAARWDPNLKRCFREIQTRSLAARISLCLSVPRREEFESALAAGVNKIIGYPCTLDELCWAVGP